MFYSLFIVIHYNYSYIYFDEEYAIFKHAKDREPLVQTVARSPSTCPYLPEVNFLLRQTLFSIGFSLFILTNWSCSCTCENNPVSLLPPPIKSFSPFPITYCFFLNVILETVDTHGDRNFLDRGPQTCLSRILLLSGKSNFRMDTNRFVLASFSRIAFLVNNL